MRETWTTEFSIHLEISRSLRKLGALYIMLWLATRVQWDVAADNYCTGFGWCPYPGSFTLKVPSRDPIPVHTNSSCDTHLLFRQFIFVPRSRETKFTPRPRPGPREPKEPKAGCRGGCHEELPSSRKQPSLFITVVDVHDVLNECSSTSIGIRAYTKHLAEPGHILCREAPQLIR